MARPEKMREILESCFPKQESTGPKDIYISAPYGRAIQVQTGSQTYNDVFFQWEKQTEQDMADNKWIFSIGGQYFPIDGNDIIEISQV